MASSFSHKSDVGNEELIKELNNVSKEYVEVLSSFWADMGLTDHMMEDRKATIIKCIEASFNKMVKEEKYHLGDLVKSVEHLAKEKMKLFRELNRNRKKSNNDSRRSLDNIPEDVPLMQLKKQLEVEIASLQEQKEERMVTIRQLMESNEETSKWVGRPPLPMPQDTILIPEELDQLRAHVKAMTDLRRQRVGQLGEMQIELDDLCKTLEEEPQQEVERHMLMDDAANVVLSDANMAAVVAFMERLQHKLADNKKRKQAMEDKIQSLCGRLGLDASEARRFMPEDDNVHDAALSAVQAKVDELDALKRENMTNFIAASKRDLEGVWNACYVSDAQKAKFLPYHTNTVDESTLESLEVELDRLKKYHEHNQALFAKVDEWHTTWNHKLEMEARSKDKNRLMGRGRNNLLEEEKERKAVQKKLPKVERELMAFVGAYAEANNEEFQVFGMNVADYITDQKSEHNIEVKEEKEIKKVIKRQQLENETRYGATAMTPINQTSAALMKSRRDLTSATKSNTLTSKRPGGNDVTGSAKRRRVNADASIVTGNLPQHSVNSVESMTLFKDKDIVSSTFCNETQTLPRTRKVGNVGLTAPTGGLRTPSNRKGMTSSTPSKSTTSLFKTPQSAASGSRLMRSAKGSGSTASLSTARSNTLGTRGGSSKNLSKVPFKL